MNIDYRITRNSGATLEPCIYKHGANAVEQGYKMQRYHAVFVPVLEVTWNGYFMPRMCQPKWHDVPLALSRLRALWTTRGYESAVTRFEHHVAQVVIYAQDVHPALSVVLGKYWKKTCQMNGTRAGVVHGDPTLENVVGGGWWLDPSTRPMPLEAELDGGKLLQSYFGYGDRRNELYVEGGNRIVGFLKEHDLNLDLCAYYLVTHLVRLYRIQAHAREWAVRTVENLEEQMEELKCK